MLILHQKIDSYLNPKLNNFKTINEKCSKGIKLCVCSLKFRMKI